MKINIVKDSAGKAVASYEASSANGTEISVHLPDGFKVEEMDVETGYEKKPDAIYK